MEKRDNLSFPGNLRILKIVFYWRILKKNFRHFFNVPNCAHGHGFVKRHNLTPRRSGDEVFFSYGVVWTPIWQNLYLGTRRFLPCPVGDAVWPSWKRKLVAARYWSHFEQSIVVNLDWSKWERGTQEGHDTIFVWDV